MVGSDHRNLRLAMVAGGGSDDMASLGCFIFGVLGQ